MPCFYCGTPQEADTYEGRPWCGECNAQRILNRSAQLWAAILKGDL